MSINIQAKELPLHRDSSSKAELGTTQVKHRKSDDDARDRHRGGWIKKLFSQNVESRGISPVPLDKRVNHPYSKIFFVWFSMNFNLLSFSAGTLGPVAFNLDIRDACLTILSFNLLCCAPPAYFCTLGPKLGMRQMIISRYSFGYYGVIVLCILNLIMMIGFSILNCILGGQALSSVTDQRLSWTVGIVVVGTISLLVSFCGYNTLNWYGRVAWFPVLMSFVVCLGVGGKHFPYPPPTEPASATAVLGFASTLAGFVISFSCLSSDFTSYFKHDVSTFGVFLASYFGLALPLIMTQCLGAAVVVALPGVPDWQRGYSGGNIGGLLAAILRPVGDFGKFLMVLFSLSVTPNIAASLYSTSLNMQTSLPFLVVVPRYVFSIVASAIVVPIAIVGAHRFYETLVNFLALVGYYPSSYAAIVLLEHTLFRENNPKNYNTRAWNLPKGLPTGIPAFAAGIASFGVVIPCMGQVWFTGPIARSTGDIGFEVAFVVTAMLYVPFRWFEIWCKGSL